MNTYGFGELTIGKKAEFNVTISEEDVNNFIYLSGDSSSIHVNDSFAEARGFQGKIVHGVLIASYVSRLIGIYLPGANGLLQSIQMQFRKPCYQGMTLRVSGEIIRHIESVKAIRIKITISDVESGIILSDGIVQSGILDLPSQSAEGIE